MSDELARLKQRVALLESQVRYWRKLATEAGAVDQRSVADIGAELTRAKGRESRRKSHKTKPQRAEASAYFRAKYANRAVSWADRKKMLEIYTQAQEMTERTGVPHHVDHIIPLRGETMSGLHVETNLRIITAVENQSRRNRMSVQETAREEEQIQCG
jgi:hypothetical protein